MNKLVRAGLLTAIYRWNVLEHLERVFLRLNRHPFVAGRGVGSRAAIVTSTTKVTTATKQELIS
jgi:hypothetical protein